MIYKKNPEALNREVRIMLINAGIRQADLAEKLGKSRQSVSNLIRQRNISLNALTDVVNAAGYDLEINFVEKK